MIDLTFLFRFVIELPLWRKVGREMQSVRNTTRKLHVLLSSYNGINLNGSVNGNSTRVPTNLAGRIHSSIYTQLVYYP